MSEIIPEKIALWGYGVFGKRTAESIKRYWGGAYIVTKIYDIEKRGRDPWWDLEISDPRSIAEDYLAGSFNRVYVCINEGFVRESVKDRLKTDGVPWFVPGQTKDIVSAEQFEKNVDCPLRLRADNYSLFCLKNMRGAVSDHDRAELMYLFSEEGTIPEESIRLYKPWDPDRALMPPFRLKNALPERVRIKGLCCVLAKLYSQNYWHFTFQIADCVSLLEDAGFQGKYVIAGTESNLALMHLLGVNDDRIINNLDLEIHKVYEFEELLLINSNGMGLDYSVNEVSGIAKKVKTKLVRRENAPKRLYVERIGRRKLLHGIETAKRIGFEVFIPEEHTVQEQMEAFYNADIVMTPHGANSTNCIYMREGTVFIELFSPRWYNSVNHHACEHLGIHYLSEIGEKTVCLNDKDDGVFADFLIRDTLIDGVVKRAEELLFSKK